MASTEDLKRAALILKIAEAIYVEMPKSVALPITICRTIPINR